MLSAFPAAVSTDGLPALITHAPRLAVEGPAPLPATDAAWSSSNWSGYAETGTFTAVTGNWTVPTVTAGARGGRLFPASAWYSSNWLGIDGYANSDLIQTGTEQDYYLGSAHYSAWWEILPLPERVISQPVSPGDVMSATIRQTPTQVTVGGGLFGRGIKTTEYDWTITIADRTRGWTFTTTQAYNGPGASAEWIVEAPQIFGQISTLANYSFPAGAGAGGDFNSAGVATTLEGPLVGAGLSYAGDAGTMTQNNAQVSTPGSPDSAATAFNALYGPVAPPPPSS